MWRMPEGALVGLVMLLVSAACSSTLPTSAKPYSRAFADALVSDLVPATGDPQKTATFSDPTTVESTSGAMLAILQQLSVTVVGDAANALTVRAVTLGGRLRSQGYTPAEAAKCQRIYVELRNSANAALWRHSFGPYAPGCGETLNLPDPVTTGFVFQYAQVVRAAVNVESCAWTRCAE